MCLMLCRMVLMIFFMSVEKRRQAVWERERERRWYIHAGVGRGAEKVSYVNYP